MFFESSTRIHKTRSKRLHKKLPFIGKRKTSFTIWIYEDIMEIVSIYIQTGLSGTDILYIQTNLPQAIYPFDESGATFKMEVAQGQAIEYAQKHFSEHDIFVLNLKNKNPNWEKIQHGNIRKV